MSAVPQTRTESVAEYAGRIRRALVAVGGGVVEGEVQRPGRSSGGMLFFTLTDGEVNLSCKVFSSQVRRLEHEPREGDLVQVRIDRPDLFARSGKLDLIVSAVRLAGEGELLRRRQELLDRLRAEGLCDPARRVPPPAFPHAVGVIAGKGSDGLADVIRALRDRWPPVRVVVCPSLVQGAAAPRALVDGLARLQEHPEVDVIVVARGGGSVQDLVAFDDERLCRALFACSTPVICAIGHTDNVPVCNHVTWSATTPSRSAELAVPSAEEVRGRLRLAGRSLAAVPERLGRRGERLADGGRALALVCARVERREERTVLAARILAAVPERLERRRERIRELGRTPRPPSPADVAALGAALDGRAAAFWGGRARELAALAVRAPGADLGRRTAEVGSLGARVRSGVRRELADHERDYGHALARLLRDARVGAARGVRGAEGRLAPTALALATGTSRRLDGAGRDLGHVVEVVAARDFRRRGWALVTDDHGAAVTRAAGVGPGDPLNLHFPDGRVRVRAESRGARA